MKKLKLSMETIRTLREAELEQTVGGVSETQGSQCCSYPSDPSICHNPPAPSVAGSGLCWPDPKPTPCGSHHVC
jgi:hypothetical protein